MSFDPIKTAEDIIQAYSTDFIGDRHVAFRNILSRYGDPSVPIKDKIPDFIRMKGPFIQVLKGPKWSDNLWTEFAPAVRGVHAPEGIDRKIVDLFSILGFRRLYQFQEEAIKAIIDDSNALVVAGTGRGKTEAWLIPILQFILRAKRGEVENHPPNSVKAVFIYPTKALAQDQLKRLIKYLVELNLTLPEEERITVGVYDGDTPSDSDPKCHSYLWNAFRYFKCPMYDSDQIICRDCDANYSGHSLVVEKGAKDKLRLMVPTRQCRTNCPKGVPIPLEFISLTRDTIRTDKVDILLTNPDTLNYRLININADDERGLFLRQPKYFVIDEVHTYSGLFGSFVSMVMKRLFQVRKNILGEADDLRVIAASATVRNKTEIFSKLAPFAQPFEVIEEKLENYSFNLPKEVPSFLHRNEFSSDAIFSSAKEWTKGNGVSDQYKELFATFGLTPNSFESGDDSTFGISLKEMMLEKLTTNQNETPNLDTVRAVHTLLSTKPLTLNDLVATLTRRYPQLDAHSTTRLVRNFITIADLAGLLENRIHLFSWPLDGYYACVNCGKIYDKPQQRCSQCNYHFVTSLAMCRYCNEEAFESWFCPYCLSLYSLQVTEKGELVYYRPPKCNCQGTPNESLRVVWRPYFTCTSCKRTVRTSSLRQCEKCGASMMLDDTASKLVCINQSCQTEKGLREHMKCPHCSADLKIFAPEDYRCISCGKRAEPRSGTTCECGGSKYPILTLPWVCNNEDCTNLFTTTEPPPSCGCGSRTFHLAGIFEVTNTFECQQCHAAFVRNTCGIQGHYVVNGTRSLVTYMAINGRFEVREAKNARRSAPCYHKHKHYNLGRYTNLRRSTENIVVTSAQYALRAQIGLTAQSDFPRLLKKAKLLCFSDSIRDMERLSRDFQEPEADWFINQLMVDALRNGPISLSELTRLVLAGVETYDDLLGKEDEVFRRLRGPDVFSSTGRVDAVSNEVDRRLLPGNYYGKWSDTRLVSNGLINIKLEADHAGLTKDELEILRFAYRQNNVRMDQLSEYVEGRLAEQFNGVTRSLLNKGLIADNGGRVRLNPTRVICSLVSPEHPILWNPSNEEFMPEISVQLGEDASDYVGFEVPYTERTDASKGSFNRVCYRINASSPLILIGESYKGTTDKTFRRELEYKFKNELYPNFLSSGPAMELGIDIGDLDILCLHGTPPNINSYLQRVGRAGRESHKSLVFSVSKRNPIDFYYYNTPVELIQSEPQPVPLNEHNPDVLRLSLTWAIFDFIASEFWVPWRKESRPDGVYVTDGEETVRIGTNALKPSEIVTFTSVYNSKNREIEYGDRLGVLGKLANDNRAELRAWLTGLLSYSYCTRCEKHYPSTFTGKCTTIGCGGEVLRAEDVWSKLVDQVIDDFPNHFVSLGKRFRKELNDEERELLTRRLSIMQKEDEIDESAQDEKQKLMLDSQSLEDRTRDLASLKSRLRDMSYSAFHKLSSEKRYSFDLRNPSDVVDVTYHFQDPKTSTFKVDQRPRDIEMALKEYHPYSVVIRNRRSTVTCKIVADEWKTKALPSDKYKDQLVCTSCHKLHDDMGKSNCDCGGPLQVLKTIVPRMVESYTKDYPLRMNVESGRGWLNPLGIHALAEIGKREVERTMADIVTAVSSFNPTQSWGLTNEAGIEIGSIDYGEMTLVSSTMQYQARYRGFSDPRSRLYEICGEEGCNSVVVERGNHLCAVDENHDASKKKFVRLAYTMSTLGIRIAVKDDPGGVLSHNLAHGIRLALQSIAGVPIRDIGESVEDTCSYVYDAVPGGSGATRLVMQDESFNHASQIIKSHVSTCRCEDGCPHCVYQFGCDKANSPSTLSRTRLASMLTAGLKIAERKSGVA